jgi:uncharacterized protein (TIGR02996 family)
MNDREALFRAICAAPDEDSPRLVFADLLEEQGDAERAEFIRLQIQLHDVEGLAEEKVAGRRRIRELESSHRNAWRADLPRGDGGEYAAEFVRGFIDSLHVTDVQAFAAHAAELFAAAPLQGLIFERLTKEQAAVIAAVPELSRIRTLRLERNTRFSADALRQLIASPHTGGVKELDLYDVGLSKEFFRVLRRAPWRLEELWMGCEYGGTFDPAPLLASAAVERLRVLNLEYRRTGPQTALAIAGNARSGSLETLHLNECELDGPSIRALAGAEHLSRLSSLNLAGNAVGPEEAEALAFSPWFGGLRHLDLSHTAIGPLGAVALAAAPRIPSLQTLNLTDCQFGPLSIVALAESPLLANVEILHLGGNHVGAAGAQALARRGRLANLRLLFIDQHELPEAEQKRLDKRFGKENVF